MAVEVANTGWTLTPPGIPSPREQEKREAAEAVLEEYGTGFEGYLTLERDLLTQDAKVDRMIATYTGQQPKVLDEDEIARVSYLNAYEAFVRDTHEEEVEPNTRLKLKARSMVTSRQLLEDWQQLTASIEATKPQELPVDGKYFTYLTVEGVSREEVIEMARKATALDQSERLIDGFRAGNAVRKLGKMVTAVYGPDFEDETMEGGPAQGFALARAIVNGANNEETTKE